MSEPKVLLANNFLNDTGIDLEEGVRYLLIPHVKEDKPLVDWFIKTDFDGFDSMSLAFPINHFLKSQEHRLRMKKAKWFTLIGLIDGQEKWEFVIGSSREVTARMSGRLYCYLNDAPDAYNNNQGEFYLEVTPLR